jgi:hypothetical protein
MVKIKFIYIFLLFCIVSVTGLAQEIAPKGMFLKDSTKIGEIIPYSLSVRYPSSLNIIFPDSLYDFSPFEWVGKEIFPTKTQNNISVDSAIYYLSTFELDDIQTLSIPIYSIIKKDSIEIFGPLDTIVLERMLVTMPDSIAALTDTRLVDIDLIFNYPYWTAGIIVTTLLIISLILIFGKSTVKKISVWKAKRAFERLKKQMFHVSQKEGISEEDMILILRIWKKYMENMTSKPYLKLSTKEIAGLGISSQTLEALQISDRWLYGRQEPSQKETIVSALIEGAERTLNEKIESINAQ